MSSFKDLESPPLSSYSPLLSPEESAPWQWKKSYFVSFALMLLMLSGLAAFIFISGSDSTGLDPMHRDPIVMDRGLKAGVSMKSSGLGMLKAVSCEWTNEMLLWERSGFHFQPEKNWMNDPNGPMYYNGWYHFFYQYNPYGPVWGNIAWGHAVSKDLLNWVHLPLAIEPDKSYDSDGVWSGSATVLPDRSGVIMLYTGLFTETGQQVQNKAIPADLSDPLLLTWTKNDSINPVIRPPKNIGANDFRDPSTAWFEQSDSTWRVAIGSKDAANNGIALVYSTKDFTSFNLLPNYLHTVEKVGMWECIDFYPIATDEAGAYKGLNTSEVPSTKTKHVLKASTSDNGQDYYAIGTYDPVKNTWVPDNKSLDVGVGLRYDWGRFYASKTFYDEFKQRRILWGWVKEADSETTDMTKGWASLQGIPRTVLYDLKTENQLLTWPVEEVDSLRVKDNHYNATAVVDAGTTYELKVGGAAQLDVEVEFTIDEKALELAKGEDEDVEYKCKTSGGAAQRGLLGPFGLLVLANQDLTEQTAAYFYVSKKSDGSLITHFCQDELRSSIATDTIKEIVGHTVPVLKGESFTLRVLIDHSIVESFAQRGRASATSRVYPTEAIYSDARLFIFNNATGVNINASSVNVWHMNSASNRNLNDL